MTSTYDSWLAAQAPVGAGGARHAIEHPADGTLSPTVSNELHWELCNGTLIVESHGTEHPGEHRVRIAERFSGASVDLRWEQWEDLKEAIEEE